MSERIEISPGGGSDIHIFGLDMDGDRARSFVARPITENGAGWPLKVALGAVSLNPVHVEHFPVSDLEGVGLATYLGDGLGIDAAEIAANRDRIDAITGDVIILRPAAFDGVEQTLTVVPPLTHVASLPTTQASETMERLRSASAAGGLTVGNAATAQPKPKSWTWHIVWSVAFTAIVLLIVFTGGKF